MRSGLDAFTSSLSNRVGALVDLVVKPNVKNMYDYYNSYYRYYDMGFTKRMVKEIVGRYGQDNFENYLLFRLSDRGGIEGFSSDVKEVFRYIKFSKKFIDQINSTDSRVLTKEILKSKKINNITGAKVLINFLNPVKKKEILQTYILNMDENEKNNLVDNINFLKEILSFADDEMYKICNQLFSENVPLLFRYFNIYSLYNLTDYKKIFNDELVELLKEKKYEEVKAQFTQDVEKNSFKVNLDSYRQILTPQDIEDVFVGYVEECIKDGFIPVSYFEHISKDRLNKVFNDNIESLLNKSFLNSAAFISMEYLFNSELMERIKNNYPDKVRELFLNTNIELVEIKSYLSSGLWEDLRKNYNQQLQKKFRDELHAIYISYGRDTIDIYRLFNELKKIYGDLLNDSEYKIAYKNVFVSFIRNGRIMRKSNIESFVKEFYDENTLTEFMFDNFRSIQFTNIGSLAGNLNIENRNKIAMAVLEYWNKLVGLTDGLADLRFLFTKKIIRQTIGGGENANFYSHFLNYFLWQPGISRNFDNLPFEKDDIGYTDTHEQLADILRCIPVKNAFPIFLTYKKFVDQSLEDKKKHGDIYQISEKEKLVLEVLSKRCLPLYEKIFSVFNADVQDDVIHQTLSLIYDDKIPEVFKKIGVDKIGTDGFNQLIEIFGKFKNDIYTGSIDIKKIADENGNPAGNILYEFFKKYIRLDVTGWGAANSSEADKAVVAKIARLNDYIKENSEAVKLPKSYEEKTFFVRKKEKVKNYQFSENFKKEFPNVLKIITNAKERLNNPKPYTSIIEDLKNVKKQVVNDLKTKIDDLKTRDVDRNSMTKSLAYLEKMNLRSLADFQENFSALSQYKEFKDLLIEAFFVLAFSKNKDYLEHGLFNINSQNPSTEDISKVIDFVDHVVNQEVASKYFKNESAKKKFTKFISVKTLEEELKKMNKHTTYAGKTQINIIPSKGLLLEFSGQIADACWANHYGLLCRDMPYVTSLTFVQNKGTKDERIVGACLLMETSSGFFRRPVLLIRGLNPIENFINNIDAEDFFDIICEYVKDIAKKTGRKPAIVIDDKRGRASSNRQTMFDYLKRIRGGLVKVRVKNETSYFNGYKVTDDCFLI